MAGLTSDQVDLLVIGVYAQGSLDPTRRRAVGPYRAVLVVLIYLRHNLSQALVAELFGCSQPTVSRLIGRLAPAITTVLTENARHVAAQQLRSTVRIDGFLAPTGDRREGTYTAGTYSGKRHHIMPHRLPATPRPTAQHPGQPSPTPHTIPHQGGWGFRHGQR
jgi:hypothetical protein